MAHDFKRVLHDKNRCAYLSPQDHDTIRFALRLAEIVTGEPSTDMTIAGLEVFDTAGCGCRECDAGFVDRQFKAMIEQAQREVDVNFMKNTEPCEICDRPLTILQAVLGGGWCDECLGRDRDEDNNNQE